MDRSYWLVLGFSSLLQLVVIWSYELDRRVISRMHRRQVKQWPKRVEALQREVDDIIRDGEEQMLAATGRTLDWREWFR